MEVALESANFSSKQISKSNTNSTVLNKLQSYYSRISILGPEGHCTCCFMTVKCISCGRHVGVNRGGGIGLIWTEEGLQTVVLSGHHK